MEVYDFEEVDALFIVIEIPDTSASDKDKMVVQYIPYCYLFTKEISD